ncbi:MAG: hypothetical protein RBT63_08080, partial [Bdellovibrionales bacterium]|nr:hypothetical protein [Bdellovibrionales bacterium]
EVEGFTVSEILEYRDGAEGSDEDDDEAVDADVLDIGKIVGFSNNGAQDLLVVSLFEGAREGVKTGDQIEIPFVEEIVVDVDEEEERLFVELPPGLIEVQLGLDNEGYDDDGGAEDSDESDDSDESNDDFEDDFEDDTDADEDER